MARRDRAAEQPLKVMICAMCVAMMMAVVCNSVSGYMLSARYTGPVRVRGGIASSLCGPPQENDCLCVIL